MAKGPAGAGAHHDAHAAGRRDLARPGRHDGARPRCSSPPGGTAETSSAVTTSFIGLGSERMIAYPRCGPASLLRRRCFTPGPHAALPRRAARVHRRRCCSSPWTPCAPTGWAAYGDAAARTPHMDAPGAARASCSSGPFSPVPLTLPAHASILTGLLPPAHGVRGNGSFAFRPGPRTLAEALRARGLAHGRVRRRLPRGAPLRPRPRLRPLRRCVLTAPPACTSTSRSAAPTGGGGGRRAGCRPTPGPVFVWVHLYDPHAPYDPPGGLSQRRSLPRRGRRRRRDDRTAAGSLGRPARSVLRGGRLRTMAKPSASTGRRATASSSTTRPCGCPLLLRGPGHRRGTRMVARRSASRTWPPRFAILPAPVPVARARAYAFRQAAGRRRPSAAALRRDPGAAPRLRLERPPGLASTGRYKYIRAPRPELYDLEADPEETRNLARVEAGARGRSWTPELEAALERLGRGESRRDRRRRSRPSACARSATCRARGDAARGPTPRTTWTWRSPSPGPPGRFPTPRRLRRAYRGDRRALDPENPLVNFRLADALLRAGRATEAGRATSRPSSRPGPRSADPFVGLATALRPADQLGRSARRASSRPRRGPGERPGPLQPRRAGAGCAGDAVEARRTTRPRSGSRDPGARPGASRGLK